MRLRSVVRSDTKVLSELWNSAARHDPLNVRLLYEKIWGDADFDASFALAGEEDGLAGFAVAVCRDREEGRIGFVKLLAIGPLSQRRGVATNLLGEIERRCAALGANEMRVGESAPNYLVPGVDGRYKAACAFFEARGYRMFGETSNMLVDLREWRVRRQEARRESASDASVVVRRATRGDEPAVRELIFQHWPLWWPEVSAALANIPVTLFIAWDGARAAGFAAHETNNRGSGWFGPMGTAPHHRGRGIGKRLLAACLDDMAALDTPEAIIPWVGPVDFYTQAAGARVARTFKRYSKSLPDVTQ